MNDRAREVLVAAALSGHSQLREVFHGTTDEEGDCVLGVLHLAFHDNCRVEARQCHRGCDDDVWWQTYALNHDERWQLVVENDFLGWDFLTIAQKHESMRQSDDE